MKTIEWLILSAALAIVSIEAEDWKKVAFVGDAKVKSISGVVEVISPQERVLREGEIAKAGEVLRIWRGSDLILQMESSEGLVRAKGPVLLRLAPGNDFRRAAISSDEKPVGFVVRTMKGSGRYSVDGKHWGDLSSGQVLPEGASVRAFRDSILDFYHPVSEMSIRVADHRKRVILRSPANGGGHSTILASTAP